MGQMTKVTTKVRTRISHNGFHAECPDTSHTDSKWRTCINQETTVHVPPSFDKGMTRAQLKDLRDFCNAILESVYDDFS